MAEENEQEGIASPPYPTAQTSSLMLYKFLALLRRWLVEQQEELRQHIPPKYSEKLTVPPNIASEASWDLVSVLDKYTVLMYLRRIREAWDHVFREHEDETWNSKLALKKRFSIVLMAQHIMEEAFVDPELREMRQQRAIDEAQKQWRLIDEHLRKVLVPPELQEQAKEQGSPEEDQWDWNEGEDHGEEAEGETPPG